MKILYKLLILMLFVSVSNSIYSQITVEQAVAIDRDKDGTYDAVEIKFSTGINDSDADSPGERDDWEFSLDPEFSDGDTKSPSNLETNVTYIANVSTADDRFIQYQFSSDFASSNGPIYLKYNNISEDINDSIASGDTVNNIVLRSAIDKAPPFISSVSSTNTAAGDTLIVGEQITFTVDFDDPIPDPDLTIYPLQYNGGDLNWATYNGGDTYVGTYTVAEGHDDQKDSPLQLLDVYAEDGYGNTGDSADPNADGSDVNKRIDAYTPVINSVASSTTGIGDTIIINDEITFTVTPDVAEDGLRVSPTTYNGQFLTWSTTSPYTATYTVADGEQDQWTPLQLIGVTLKDTAGNVSASMDGSVSWKIDANRPDVDYVSSVAVGAGDTLIVGDQITFTVGVVTADGTLSVSPSDYNGQPLNWYTSDGGNTYTGVYTVTEGNPKQNSPKQLENVTLTDPAGNSSNPADPDADGIDVVKGIDANTPVINTITSVTTGIGDTIIIDDEITFTVTPVVAQDGLRISPTTYNGQTLSWSTTSPYVATYTVADGEQDQWTPLQLTGVTLKDTAGNVSASEDGSVSWKIDANRPSINNTVTSDATAAGVLKVGDQITFYVDVVTPDGSLTVNTVSGYNGQSLNWYTNDGGDTYEGVYTVTEGEDDQDPAIDLTGVTVIDLGGNESSPPKNCTDVNKTIDANSPIISGVTVSQVTMLYDQTYTVTVNVVSDDGDLYNLVSGKIADFDFYNRQRNSSTSYSLDFTVGDLGYDILEGESYDITNLVLSDPAGNLSDPYSVTVTQPGDPIYTVLPTAKVTGEYDVCHGDDVELVMQLTGSAPWEIELHDGTGPDSIISVNESPYYCNIKKVKNTLGYEPDTLFYKVAKVTDVNGNVKIMPDLDTAFVYAYKLPVVDITYPAGDKTYNIEADADTLEASPTDGVFSGSGIVASNNTFLASSAGLGTHKIKYKYTETSSGCFDTDSVEFEVIESDADITFDNGDDDWRCDYESTMVVTAEVITDPGIEGTLSLYPDPGALTPDPIVKNKAEINISILDAGTYQVKFEYFDGGWISVIKSFTVETVGDVNNPIDFTDLTNVCEDYDTVFIHAVNLIPSGGEGKYVFSGPGGSFEYDPLDSEHNSGYLLPGQVTSGSYNMKYVYTTPNGCESDTVAKYFDVNALPPVSFTMNAVYNIDQGSSTIDGSPLGATGVFTPLSFMSNNGDGTADFDPADAGIGMWWVKYTYEDINGCVDADSMEIEVNKALGEITSSSGSFQFCYYGSSTDTLTGTPNPTDGSAGSFYIDDILITPESDNKILFNPQDYLAGDHTVKYAYNNGTTAYEVYKTVNIDSIGDLYFTGLDLKYCEDEDVEVELTASYPGQDGVMKFTGNGITDDIVDNLGFFNPSDGILGDDTITYTFTRDYSGCQKTYNEITTVNKIPVVAFYPNEQCIVSSGDAVGFTSDTLLSDSVVIWQWSFKSQVVPDQSPSFNVSPGYNTVGLKLETNQGCTYKIDSLFYIGTRVELEFTFENECHGETVLFDLLVASDTEDTLSTSWSFGGAGIADMSDREKPTFIYDSPGAYDVIYEEYLGSCGRIADTVRINIRPSVDLSVGEYLEEFEDNPDITGWVIEDFEEGANNTWQWGEPTGAKINGASSGTNAFATNLNGNYGNSEKGMITSPCFDFSSMQRPMMKMDFISYTEEDRDGAVIQYTKPNGDWATIGVPNDGINWYNSYIITGAPADQQLGWTGEIVGEDVSGWQTAMYRLDELRGRAGVRFRIVFGSDAAGADNEGFAFDNIQFSERKRIVLLENFTNIKDDDANITQEDVIDPILVKDSLDVINLNYHTSFPYANDFNSFYPSGPSARALFYGVANVPYSLVDGGERNYDYTLTNTLTESDIHKRMLIEPQFDISVRQDIQANNFVVSSTVKALEEMTGQNIVVYVAIIEKTILDGSDQYNNVLRTMLPDGAGILVEKDWIVGDSVNVYQTWSIPENVNTDSLRTIVFVQDEDLKDIYQTAFTEKFSTITSVDEIIDNIIGIDYMVYPNPVKEILSVQLTKSLNYNLNVDVYNSVGAIVKSDMLFKGNYLIEINTNDLPAGVYYLRLTNTDKFFSTKKIIKTE